MTDTLLTVENLGIRIRTGGRVLVDGIDLTIGRGAKVGIIGESGSGKSLTALALSGLLPDTMDIRGRISYDGVTVLDHPTHAPVPDTPWRALRGRRVATVFQEPLTALDPLMRIEALIGGPLRLHHGLRGQAARTRTLELLDQVRLPLPRRILKAYPHELSGGQRQRVAIAMALACAPDLLVADEPTTALDVTVQADIVTLLHSLVDELGMALLFITHDLPLVAGIVDDLVVMKQGRQLESGPAATIVRAPQDTYTRDLMTAAVEISRLPYRDDRLQESAHGQGNRP